MKERGMVIGLGNLLFWHTEKNAKFNKGSVEKSKANDTFE